MWYIDAMISKGLAIAAVLLVLTQVPLSAQAAHHSGAAQQAQSPYPSPLPAQAKPDCNGVPCEEQQPLREITISPPPPTPWYLHEKILWGVDVVLAILGYAGILLALSTLKKIEHHAKAFEGAFDGSMKAVEATAKSAAAAAETAGETAKIAAATAETAAATAETATRAATAALVTAQAALLQAQAIVHAERPWVLVTAEPTHGVESSFEITATNRGRSPARVTASLDQVLFATDEARLPDIPELKQVASGKRFVPIILLPGESAALKTFSRDDARRFCESDEMFRSLESWEQRLFLVGRVSYTNLMTPEGAEAHQTNWCCWYIHGKHRSALVPAGGAAYNAHS